jgi:hypothetical protein
MQPRQQQQQAPRAPLVAEVAQRGARRTAALIAANQHLPAADKAALAQQERLKGNEHLK